MLSEMEGGEAAWQAGRQAAGAQAPNKATSAVCMQSRCTERWHQTTEWLSSLFSRRWSAGSGQRKWSCRSWVYQGMRVRNEGHGGSSTTRMGKNTEASNGEGVRSVE